MLEGGWIKIHRKMLNWRWASSPATLSTFLHLLLLANYEDVDWRDGVIRVGQCVTSVASLSLATGLTTKQTRTALKHLQSTGEIVVKGANKYSIVTICKYAEYQSMEDSEGQTKGKQRANKGQTKGNDGINKETNKEKDILSLLDKSRIPPTLEEVELFNTTLDHPINPNQFIDFYTSKGWLVGKSKMKDWQAAVRGWALRTNKESNNKTNRRSTDVPTNPDYTIGF